MFVARAPCGVCNLGGPSALSGPGGVAPVAMHPGTARLLKREQWVQRTPEWYEARRDLITASEAASALGVKPFKSYRGDPREELMRKKVGNEPLENMFVTHGQKYEDAARDWAAAALGETVEEVGLVRHETLPWLGASPDGVTHRGRLMEIKCPMKRAIQPGVVPSHYWPQVQVQMECCDIDETIFVQYKPATLTADGRAFLDVVVVQRDRKWFEDHKDALHEFWVRYMAERAKQPSPRPETAAPGDDNTGTGTGNSSALCRVDDALYL